MRIMKYYNKRRRPDTAEIVRLDKVNEGGDKLLVTYPLHLTEGRRLNMWLRADDIYVDWVREVSDEVIQGAMK